MPDQYPDGNPKTIFGMSKPSTRAIPSTAIFHLGAAMADGERKYGRFNWREKTVTVSVYTEAMLRHLFAYIDGENHAPDSGCTHLGHLMACAAILLDAHTWGNINDDRLPGPAPAILSGGGHYALRINVEGQEVPPAPPLRVVQNPDLPKDAVALACWPLTDLSAAAPFNARKALDAKITEREKQLDAMIAENLTPPKRDFPLKVTAQSLLDLALLPLVYPHSALAKDDVVEVTGLHPNDNRTIFYAARGRSHLMSLKAPFDPATLEYVDG